MPLPPPFPIQAEDLTTEFLSDALDATVAAFTATRIGHDRGMLGDISRIHLECTSGPAHIVAKFAALREGSLASALRGRNYERELRCYEELLAGADVRTPEFLGGWYDPDTAHFLLLQESIETDDTVDQIDGLTADQARRVLTEVAKFHASRWRDPMLVDLDWLPSLDGPTRLGNLTTLAQTGWPRLVDLLGDDLPAVPDDFGRMLPDRIESSLRSISTLPHTLLHCDLRADNLLFDPHDGAVTIVDWQGCGVGPAAFDVAYFLTQSLTTADRREHEAALLAHWVSELTSRGVDASAAQQGYAESLWYGLAVACALPVISDPDEPRVRELARAVTQRSIAALADHRQIEENR